jgi:hypothetical protein
MGDLSKGGAITLNVAKINSLKLISYQISSHFVIFSGKKFVLSWFAIIIKSVRPTVFCGGLMQSYFFDKKKCNLLIPRPPQAGEVFISQKKIYSTSKLELS